MLSQIPYDLKKINQAEIDKELLRAGAMAELDAVSLYEQMAAMAENETVRKVMLDVAKEEKTHFGEFQAMLLKLDEEQVRELEKGKKEVEELGGRE